MVVTNQVLNEFQEGTLLNFLKHSEKRINNMMNRAKSWRKMERFQDIVKELERVVKGTTIHFYGTKMMELGHPRSHLNMFMDFENSYWLTQDHDKIKKLKDALMEYFAAEVKNPLSCWKEGPVELKTPVPTVRMTVNPKNKQLLQCDITFSSGLGVENSNLVRHLFTLQPEAFKLYHFVRIWIHIDMFSFKRYMVALMVIFYLQNINLLPSVQTMQEDVKEKFIEGWNVNFNVVKKIEDYGMTKMKNYEDVLIGFFEFFAAFDFTNNVICPYLGKSIPIELFRQVNEGKVEELKKYSDTIKNFNFAAVNVADLLNLKFNVAYGVGQKRLTRFNSFCPYAVELLRENL